MRLLVTAGPTREYIDTVRFISNASSGKMGYALARAALKAGCSVTLITGPTSLRPPAEARVINIETAVEMSEAVKKHFKSCDCLIMAAAVADYSPVRTSKTKIKKTNQPLTIKLKPTTDILKWAGKNKKHQFLVGFALEDKNIRPNAEKKLREKNLDMIIANTPAAVAAEKTCAQIKTPTEEWLTLPAAAKATIAAKIIKLLKNTRL